MSKIYKTTSYTLLLLISIVFSACNSIKGPCSFYAESQNVPFTEIYPQVSGPSKLTRVSARSSKGTYSKNEPISIFVQADGNAYIYAFYVTGQGQKFRLFKDISPNDFVSANERHELKFSSRSTGLASITIVAAERQLTSNEIESISISISSLYVSSSSDLTTLVSQPTPRWKSTKVTFRVNGNNQGGNIC